MKNNEGHYILTDADIKAYKRMLDATYNLDIRSSSERELETHGYWRVNAPAGNNMYYTMDGRTLEEAIDKWFAYIQKNEIEPFFK